jgi:hypothetical protein
MRGYMFRNRWFALLFVCITLAGVTKLVGTDKEHGAIQQTADQFAAQRAQAAQMTTAPQETPADTSADDVPYADDDELIDLAVGEDPTPVDEFAANSSENADGPSDEVTIVSRDVPDETPDATPDPAPGN